MTMSTPFHVKVEGIKNYPIISGFVEFERTKLSVDKCCYLANAVVKHTNDCRSGKGKTT